MVAVNKHIIFLLNSLHNSIEFLHAIWGSIIILRLNELVGNFIYLTMCIKCCFDVYLLSTD